LQFQGHLFGIALKTKEIKISHFQRFKIAIDIVLTWNNFRLIVALNYERMEKRSHTARTGLWIHVRSGVSFIASRPNIAIWTSHNLANVLGGAEFYKWVAVISED
jgi:hypothetical protein